MIARICAILALLLLPVWEPAALFAADEPAAKQEDPHADGEHVHVGHAGGVNTEPHEFKPDLAIFSFFVFVLLLLVLWKFAWDPICAGLDKREKRIADHIASAEKMHADAAALTRQYEEKLAASADEVRKIIEEARRDGEHTLQELVAKGQEEAQALRDRALREIDTARMQALKELAEKSAEAAVSIASTLIKAELKPEDHRKLIDEAVERLREAAAAPSKN